MQNISLGIPVTCLKHVLAVRSTSLISQRCSSSTKTRLKQLQGLQVLRSHMDLKPYTSCPVSPGSCFGLVCSQSWVKKFFLEFGFLLCFQYEKKQHSAVLFCFLGEGMERNWIKATLAFLAKLFKQDKSLHPLKYIKCGSRGHCEDSALQKCRFQEKPYAL